MRTVAIAATANRTALTTAGSTASPAMSLLPRSVSPISPLARATVNSEAPTTSTRPARRGVSQPADAAQASAIATIPIGTFT